MFDSVRRRRERRVARLLRFAMRKDRHTTKGEWNESRNCFEGIYQFSLRDSNCTNLFVLSRSAGSASGTWVRKEQISWSRKGNLEFYRLISKTCCFLAFNQQTHPPSLLPHLFFLHPIPLCLTLVLNEFSFCGPIAKREANSKSLRDIRWGERKRVGYEITIQPSVRKGLKIRRQKLKLHDYISRLGSN